MDGWMIAMQACRRGHAGEALRELEEAEQHAPDAVLIPQPVTRIRTMTSPISAKPGANRSGLLG